MPQFNVFKMLKNKDKDPKKMQPKQGFVAPPHPNPKAVAIMKKDRLVKNPGK